MLYLTVFCSLTYSTHENVFLGCLDRVLKRFGVVPLFDGAQLVQGEQTRVAHRVLRYGAEQTGNKSKKKKRESE